MTDARHHLGYALFAETGVGAGVAGFSAGVTGRDALDGDGVVRGRIYRVAFEHLSDVAHGRSFRLCGAKEWLALSQLNRRSFGERIEVVTTPLCRRSKAFSSQRGARYFQTPSARNCPVTMPAQSLLEAGQAGLGCRTCPT